MNQDEFSYPLWLMVQLFSRRRRRVFGTASVPIIRIANICVMEAKNTRKLKHIHRSALLFDYNDGMDYGKIVKQLREKTLLGQEEMAKKLGVSFATVNRWENAHHEPAFKERRKLREPCKKYHIDFE